MAFTCHFSQLYEVCLPKPKFSIFNFFLNKNLRRTSYSDIFPQCDACKPLFNNKPFRKGDNRLENACQPCLCNGHADSCVYNVTLDPMPESHADGGGGVCVNCQHNTVGRFCETCATEYFRPTGVSLSDPEVCQPCACSAIGTVGKDADCSKVSGIFKIFSHL